MKRVAEEVLGDPNRGENYSKDSRKEKVKGLT